MIFRYYYAITPTGLKYTSVPRLPRAGNHAYVTIPTVKPRDLGDIRQSATRWRDHDKRDGFKVWSCSLVLYCFWHIHQFAMETETIDQLEQGGGALRTIKDLAAGAAGGMAQVLLGMCARSIGGRESAIL